MIAAIGTAAVIMIIKNVLNENNFKFKTFEIVELSLKDIENFFKNNLKKMDDDYQMIALKLKDEYHKKIENYNENKEYVLLTFYDPKLKTIISDGSLLMSCDSIDQELEKEFETKEMLLIK